MFLMMTDLFKRFQLRFVASAFFRCKSHILIIFLSYALKIKRRRALLVQMEQMLFILSISFLHEKNDGSKFVGLELQRPFTLRLAPGWIEGPLSR